MRSSFRKSSLPLAMSRGLGQPMCSLGGSSDRLSCHSRGMRHSTVLVLLEGIASELVSLQAVCQDIRELGEVGFLGLRDLKAGLSSSIRAAAGLS